MVKFVLPLPDKNDKQFKMTPTQKWTVTPEKAHANWEQACRQKWRALAAVIKAKLVAVEAGITTFEDEFLAHIQLPDGQSVGHWLRPQLAMAYESHEMPKSLLALTGAERNLKRMATKQKPEGRYVCKCACGGKVRGVREFNRLFTWCDTCTPVQKIKGDLNMPGTATTLATPPGVRKLAARPRNDTKHADDPRGQIAKYLRHVVDSGQQSEGSLAKALKKSERTIRTWLLAANSPKVADLDELAEALGFADWVDLAIAIRKHGHKK